MISSIARRSLSPAAPSRDIGSGDTAPGVLAIFNNCKAGREADFEAWFQGEHLEERLAVPGFLFGRRHEALSGSSGYFNFYVVERPEVLTSAAYLARLDDPTPMTHKIMSGGVFQNMSRTICTRVMRRGAFRAAYAVTVRYSEEPEMERITALIDELVRDPAIASGEIWRAVDPAGQPVSMEEKLRGGDRKIKACLMIDTLRQADAEQLGARLSGEFVNADVGVFRVLCQIGRGDL